MSLRCGRRRMVVSSARHGVPFLNALALAGGVTIGTGVGRMAVRKIAHPSIDDRKAMGLEARDQAAPSSHTKWTPAADRPDPVALLEEQDATRELDLVPLRHGR